MKALAESATDPSVPNRPAIVDLGYGLERKE
jgi:hypothetical protein